MSDSVAKNTSFYTLALVLQKVLAFVYFSFIARFLGTEATGQYVFALSFTTLFAIFIDLGLASVLTRETARERNQAQRYLSNVLALKVPLAFLIYFLVFIMVNILGYESETRGLVYLSGLIMVLDSFSLTFWSILRGHQKLKYESLGVIALQFVTVGVGIFFLFQNKGPFFLLVALLLGSAINLSFSIWSIVKRVGLSIIPHYEPRVLAWLFKIGLPFALLGIFNRIYTSLDSVLLNTLSGSSALGIYSIPVKITNALQFMPMAFMAALFPAMSEIFVSDKKRLARIFEKAMRYLIVVSLPIAIGISILARPFVISVYTYSYIDSVDPLRILMVSLFFLFINFPVGYLLNATNLQAKNTMNMGIAVVVNIIFNIILIPRFSYVGAAVASLASTLVLFTLGLVQAGKVIDYNRRYLFLVFWKSILSSAVMGVVIFYLIDSVQWYWLVVIAVPIYFGVLFFLRGIKRDDFWEIKNSFL